MSLSEKVIPYLNSRATDALGYSTFDEAEVSELYGGDYNHNFRISNDGNDYLLRINIEPQSGSDTQIEYEYETLKFLEAAHITPKPLFLDNSRSYFEYGVLIEDFIEGNHLVYSEDSIRRAAGTFATLHTFPIKNSPLNIRNNLVADQLNGLQDYYDWIKSRVSGGDELVGVGLQALAALKVQAASIAASFKPTSICHTDPNCANLIDNGESVILIDWEQGRIDDPSYDVAAFLSPILNRWASERVMTEQEKEQFLTHYVELTGFTDIHSKLQIRFLAYALTAAIWARGRIIDVDEGKIDPRLGRQNYERYQRMADLLELKKLID